MKYKNYYKILGLASAKASDDEVKSAYRHLANNILLQLWQAQAISVEQLLEHGDFPFADELLQSIKSQREQLEQGKVPDGLSPELMAKVQQGANMQAVEQMRGAMAA